MAPKRKQAQLCLVTYVAVDGSHVHAVVPPSQRILLAQVGRLAVDHGLVEHDLRPDELKSAMTALKSIAGTTTVDMAHRHVPKPHAWGFDMPEPICTCRIGRLGDRLLDPSCQIHGGLPEQTCTCWKASPSHLTDPSCQIHGGTCTCQPTKRDPHCVVHGEGLR